MHRLFQGRTSFFRRFLRAEFRVRTTDFCDASHGIDVAAEFGARARRLPDGPEKSARRKAATLSQRREGRHTMSVRLVGSLFGALAVGAIVVACAGTEPTRPSPSGMLKSVASSSCSPDTQAPTVTFISASPNVLWPPNHTMQLVTLHWGAVDNCGSPPCAITSITSNEPV